MYLGFEDSLYFLSWNLCCDLSLESKRNMVDGQEKKRWKKHKSIRSAFLALLKFENVDGDLQFVSDWFTEPMNASLLKLIVWQLIIWCMLCKPPIHN